VIVVDTSAVLAILFKESEAGAFRAAIEAAEGTMVSAATRVETAMVIEGRHGDVGRVLLEAFWRAAEIETAPVTQAQAVIAIEAFRRFGRGRHRAALNLGDCFAYALAKSIPRPLLYKGQHFAQTDIASAL